MSQGSRLLRGGARAVAGAVVVGVCATAVVLLGGASLPEVVREPAAITVDTTQDSSRTLVCAGSFAELGADPARPSVAIPRGEPSVVVSGAAAAAALTRPEGNEGAPATFTAPLSEPLAAAQLQSVETENLRGLAASACAEPLNEQWLLGGGTSAGISTTLSLANPGKVPATVRIEVFDENGPVDSVQSAGVLVAPGSQQTVSLSGYAPDRERVAVRVVSTGAPVTAGLGIGQVEGISPFAVSSVTRQGRPQEQLVLPGIANVSDHDSLHASDAGEGDEFPVIVRVFAPDGGSGTARLRALGDGGSVELGTVDFAGDAVAELRIVSWPEGAHALAVEADVPVLAAALGSSTVDERHDYEWVTPAPPIAADQAVAAPVVAGGRPVIANAGGGEARGRVARADGSGDPATVRVPAGGSVLVRSPATAVLTSSEPVSAGVRVLGKGAIAAYPVLAPDAREGELTVYTR
ncbi:DUF5719 family protein [Leucobacter massiliensis]|uniref:Large extracellular alpha-helical protein n=1 Tax=Leucobacter massiliensis TaxID=1686285 RepID=A0A2S9QLV9_9MICO|nr:DUF5719 family protein [Leucobacter massiliensis]PRI10580.1 hypothetical protein B4915_11320 [Leucobacter massiliensis]